MIEVQDIFQQYGTEYREKHKLSLAQLKAMSAIEKCRTSQLGGHIDKCENCGSTQTSYNSCRNRHCPKMSKSCYNVGLTLKRATYLILDTFM